MILNGLLLGEDTRHLIVLARERPVHVRNQHLTREKTALVQEGVVVLETPAVLDRGPDLGEQLEEQRLVVEVGLCARELGQAVLVDEAPDADEDEELAQAAHGHGVAQDGGAREAGVALVQRYAGQQVQRELSHPLDQVLE